MSLLKGLGMNKTTILAGSAINEYIDITTLFYVVVVLAALLFIMIITYFVKIKPSLKSDDGEQNVRKNNTIDNVISKEQDLVNDTELVAVITAAIYASMGDNVPSNGFVVRSIRKVNNKKWMNA